jgi:hypothetical protein
MTAVPDHRPGRVVLACKCGHVLELPENAAEAARPLWERLHSGPGHGQVADLAEARRAPGRVQFEAFIQAAGYGRRS